MIILCQENNINDDDNNDHRVQKEGLAIEEVWVVWGRAAIELENIEKIVVLSMNISAHSDVLVLRYSDFYQWWHLLECFHSLQMQSNKFCYCQVYGTLNECKARFLLYVNRNKTNTEMGVPFIECLLYQFSKQIGVSHTIDLSNVAVCCWRDAYFEWTLLRL